MKNFKSGKEKKILPITTPRAQDHLYPTLALAGIKIFNHPLKCKESHPLGTNLHLEDTITMSYHQISKIHLD